jgi:hypothetical protein
VNTFLDDELGVEIYEQAEAKEKESHKGQRKSMQQRRMRHIRMRKSKWKRKSLGELIISDDEPGESRGGLEMCLSRRFPRRSYNYKMIQEELETNHKATSAYGYYWRPSYLYIDILRKK